MSSHEQIEGDLTLYALGSLDAPASRVVEEHLAACVPCRNELAQLRGDMGLLGLSAMGPEPPSQARARLLNAIAREPRASRGSLLGAPRGTAMRWWILLPAVASLVMLSALLVLVRQNGALRQNMVLMIAQSEQDRAYALRARQVLAVITAPDALRVTLVAGNTRPQPQGKAIYTARTGSLVFLASNFAPVAEGKAYELWLVPANGEPPMAAGTFKPDSRGNASVLMPSVPKDTIAKAFAVTVEPEGGSAKATSPIVLSGGA